MTTDEYVPDDDDVRSVWVVHERDCGWEPHPGDPSAEFDRFLARVRRDAAREALGALAEHSDSRDGDGVKGRLGGIIRIWRDGRYPEETP